MTYLCNLFRNKKKARTGKKRAAAQAFRFLLLLGLALLLPAIPACSLLPPESAPQHFSGDGQRNMDKYAGLCYQQGLRYMEEFRYELARQQFAYAASAAASPGLYADAVDGLRRAERLILEGR
ncbi:MAG: hypothetical protein BM485_03375 [Desulfobulbaceae bacterium DB1]|nr:MAG: hypothetical protein BM485_03375 [Desulfobulbaceae bacterium DB1]